jgi:hypothetical protein
MLTAVPPQTLSVCPAYRSKTSIWRLIKSNRSATCSTSRTWWPAPPNPL